MCSRRTSPYQGLAQNALILMPGLLLVSPFQSHFGNAPQGLLPD